jgi:ABC-2 type transport system permease protein
MFFFRELFNSRELLVNLTSREVKGKYKRTILGQLWSLANPLVAMLVYTFVFAFIFRVEPAPGDPSGLNVFAVWLLCGLLPWMFFANVVNLGSGSLVSNAGLIQKVYFSRVVLPLSMVFSAAYNWLFEMAVLIVVLAIVGSFIWPWVPLVLLMMILLALFAAGIAMMVSVANVYFRDTEHIVSLALPIWMYLTPIIYPISLVAEQSERLGGLLGTQITLLDLYRLNPLERFVAVFRQVLYDNTWPNPADLLFCLVVTVISLGLGFLVFNRNEKGLAEAL